MKLGKLLPLILLVVASLALPAIGMGAPQSQLTGTFASAFRVINTGTAVAKCSYQLFNNDGTSAFSATLPDTNPGESSYVYTPDVSGLSAGTYAGTVNCTQPVAAVVNYSDEKDPKGDAYVATSQPATTLYIPTAYKNYYQYFTNFRIQNTSSSQQRVQVDYYASGSSTPLKTDTVTIPGNGAATVEQSSVAELAADTPYSAKLTALDGGLIAAVVQIYGTGTVAKQLYAYSAFSGGATKFFQPVILSAFYGYNTATTIQNIGSAAATVKLTYSNGTVKNYTIQPNSAQVVLDYTEVPAADSLYSSVVESTNSQNLIVLVNESTPTTHRATTYVGETTGATKVYIPIALRMFYGYNSSITCQNLGSASTPVRVSFKGTNDAGAVTIAEKVAGTAAVGQSVLIYQPDETALGNGFIGSAVVTADQNVGCIVNQDQNLGAPASQPNDFLAAYNAIPGQ